MEKMSVLIADDSRSIRVYLEDILTSWGYNVTTCADGDEAWKVLQSGKYFPIIILDWIMPGFNGVELTKLIRTTLKQSYQYIMILTGKTTTSDVIEGLEAGADDYLVKPFVPAELKARINVANRIYYYEQELTNKEYEVRLSCYSALTELAETRDCETGNHLYRIAKLTSRLAQEIGIDQKMIEQLELFSPMHDIGKVGIPDNILYLPRKLTTEEFEIMKTHSTIGYEILRDKPTMELAAEIALSHHEKWDGTGYPRGIGGTDIPLSCRIVSIVDVYDALRSKRPYKEAIPHAIAIEIIKGLQGTSFDPKLVKAFCGIELDIATIYDYANASRQAEQAAHKA